MKGKGTPAQKDPFEPAKKELAGCLIQMGVIAGLGGPVIGFITILSREPVEVAVLVSVVGLGIGIPLCLFAQKVHKKTAIELAKKMGPGPFAGSYEREKWEEKYGAREKEATLRGTLTIESVPPSAEVFLDSSFIGMTPATDLNIEEGRHRVEIRLRGHKSWSREINVIAGQRVPLNVILEKEEESLS